MDIIKNNKTYSIKEKSKKWVVQLKNENNKLSLRYDFPKSEFETIEKVKKSFLETDI